MSHKRNDLRDIASVYSYLSGKYGPKEALKILITILVGVFIGMVVILGIWFFSEIIDRNKEFVLSDNNRYIIEYAGYSASKSKRKYYEIDFEKEKATYRADSESLKREKLFSLKEVDYKELRRFIDKIISDENNSIEPTEEEQVRLVKNSITRYYIIINYKGEKHYIKNLDDIKKLDELL